MLRDRAQTPSDYVLSVLGVPRETRQLEFKEARNQYKLERAADYCAALANEGGGALILGVSDALPRQLVGTQAFRDPQEAERWLHEKLRLRVDVNELWVGGTRVVLIEVGSRHQGQPVAYDGRYRMRQGESLVDMTADQLRKIFDEGRPALLARSLSAGLTPSEVEDLLDTRAMFALSGDDAPGTAERRCQVLASQRLLRRDGGRYDVLGMGAALFARDLSDFPELSPRRLRFIQYAGTDRREARRDVMNRRGYGLAFGEILEAVEAAVPVDERIVAAHRETIPMYAPVTLRELLANAIAHQDFDEPASFVSVELYDDRVEVTNPGRPLMDPRRFVEDTKPRNPDLAMMLRQLGICEARGSGIQRSLEANERLGSADPRFHTGEGLTRATLIGKHDFTLMSAPERNWAVFMHACRMWAQRSPITNQTLRARYGLTSTKSSLVSGHFQQSLEEGLIKPLDADSQSKRYARYIPFYADA